MCMFAHLLLQFLIGEVNAQLFKAVNLEIFKTKNIQNSNKAAMLCS